MPKSGVQEEDVHFWEELKVAQRKAGFRTFNAFAVQLFRRVISLSRGRESFEISDVTLRPATKSATTKSKTGNGNASNKESR